MSKRPLCIRNRQFNFKRHWAKVEPHLKDPEILHALEIGRTVMNSTHARKDCPPWQWPGIEIDGPEPNDQQIRWYQPYKHHLAIAPFDKALGELLFPQYAWGYYYSSNHAIAAGMKLLCGREPIDPNMTEEIFDEQVEVMVIMDVLCFDLFTAEQSLDYIQGFKEFDQDFDAYWCLHTDAYIKDAFTETIWQQLVNKTGG